MNALRLAALALVCARVAFANPAGLTVPGTTAYPNNGMRRIGQCELSDNFFRSLYNGAYDPTTGYAYFSTAAGTTVNPGRIIKVDCNGLTPVEVGSCQAASGESNLNCAVLDTVNGYGYFGALSNSPGHIVKIALGAGNTPPSYVNSLTLDPGEDTVQGAVADVANGYAYFACGTATSTIVKVQMTPGNGMPIHVSARTMNPGEGRLRRGAIDTVNGYAYFASAAGAPLPIVAKIALGAGAAQPTRVGVVTLDSAAHNIGGAVIDSANGYGYFGTYDPNVVPSIVYKVALGVGNVAPTLVANGAVPLNGVERELCSGLIDPSAGYAYFGTDHTYPGKVYRFRLGAGTAPPVESGTLVLLAGAQSKPDGQNASNVIAVPPALPLPYGEVFLQSAIYDTARGYGYFGTDSSPGQIVKVGFSQKSQIKGTRVVLSDAAAVSDLRFYSHAASGNIRLAIYDNAATKNLLWQSAPTANNATEAWLTIPVSNLTLAPGTYWLAWQIDSSADVPSFTAGAAGDGFSLEQTYGAFPTALNGTTSTTERWSMYLNYDAIPPIGITTNPQLAFGVTGTAISIALAATGGTTPYGWSLVGGALPAGVSLSSAGLLSGTPSAAGTYNFTVQAADQLGATATQQFTMTIEPRVPSQWASHGMGGGGGMYAPSFSPFDPNELYLSCDMSEVFHTTTLGTAWETVDFRQLEGFRESEVQFTSDPLIRYVLDFSFDSAAGIATQRPRKSIDGGATWAALAAWGGKRAYSVWADPSNTTRLVVATANDIYVSNDGGANFSASLFNLTNNRIAGVFFDGLDIYIGCNAGLLVSHDGGGSIASAGIGGIPSGEAMFSFAGAKQNGTVRFYCVTLASFVVFPGAILNPFVSRGVYTMDVGQGNWTPMMNGFTTGTDFPSHVAMARNNISTVYVAAARGSTGTFYPDRSTVFKANAPGATWQRIFIIVPTNQNIITGWAGTPHSSSLNFANPIGFTVHPSDATRVCLTDDATAHVTTNGGTTWKQIYVNPSDQNPANTSIPSGKAYHGVGLEPTACFWLQWLDASNLLAGYSDMRLIRSHDGGASWAYDYSGLSDGECYQILQQPATGRLYALSSTIISPYGILGSDNDSIDAATGTVRLSSNGGATWSTLHNFGGAPMWIAFDPLDAETMYVAVAHSTNGGIYLTQNLSAGINASWTKLSAPARATGGHPYNIRLLGDGSLVCSYSLNYDGSSFAQTSGVFLTANPTAGASATWLDRSATGMKYWTHDVVIDPSDSTQQIWYACVWNAFGAGNPNPSQQGGLYKTINRGQSWARIFTADVTSCTINPINTEEMYVTTRFSGLWHCDNLHAAGATFTQIAEYPFREPTRVFFNPYSLGEAWVTSNGNGLRAGSVPFVRKLDAWRATHFRAVEFNDLAISGALADPDADGRNNLLEFTLGTDPKAPGVEGAPAFANEAGYLTLTLARNPAATDVSINALVSGDLQNWNSGPAFTTVLADTPTLYKVRDNIPLAGAPHRFIRLQITEP